MARWFTTSTVLALGLVVVPGIGPASARAQTFDRDTTITGPRGRSITRDVQINRGPGGVSRDISISRPGGTFQRNSFIPRGGGGGGGFRGWGPGPRFGPPVFIGGGGGGGIGPWGAGLLGGALGAGAGFLAGTALSNANNAAQAAPPPPPVVVQQPVVVAEPGQVVVAPGAVPPPVVEYVPPVRYQPAPQQTVVVDPVAQEIARFQSNSEGSRRDAAIHLGRMGDARAVAPLVDRLKNDHARDVRVAAATALGEIGDPTAAIYLERSIIYDKKQEVRDASTAALSRVRQVQAQMQQQMRNAAASAPMATAGGFGSSPAQTSQVPALTPSTTNEFVPPPPAPANGLR